MKARNQTAGWLICGVKRAYTRFLRAYPTAFWETYAAEMAEVFSEQVDEVTGQGPVALLRLALSEFWHTSAAILRAYWLQRGSIFARVWRGIVLFFHTLLKPDPPGGPDGRTSWKQAGLENALLIIWGAGLVLYTYLPDPWKRLFDPLTALILVIPLLWLMIGLARKMPRWAYPALGILLGYCFFAGLEAKVWLLLCTLLLLGLGLLVWANQVDRKTPFLPGVFRAWRSILTVSVSSSASDNFSSAGTSLSFGLYGLLALAIILAYDNSYANNRTLWLLVSVLCMIGGAAAYSRSRKAVFQVGALAAGTTLSLLAAWIDHARFAPPQQPGPLWIFAVWLFLLTLILAPPLSARLLRLFLERRARERPTDGD